MLSGQCMPRDQIAIEGEPRTEKLTDDLLAAASVFRGIVSGSEALLSHFVVDGAPFQVNIGSATVRRLRAATVSIAGSVDASATAQSEVIAGLVSTLHEAEHEVFVVIVSGPAFRLLQDVSRFGAWAEAERAALLMAQ